MWTLGTVRIFVTESDQAFSQTIARLQPLNSGTVHQYFGYEGETKSISFFIVGDTDLDAIVAMARGGNSYTLSGYYGVEGDYFIRSFQPKRQPSIRQTLRQDLATTSPVYSCSADLLLDE